MSLFEDGRFCESCKCKVHDFARSSVEEILGKYNEHGGTICGRISTRLLVAENTCNEIKKGYFHHLKMFAWAAVFSFGASLFILPSAKAGNFLKSAKKEMLRMENDTAGIEISGTVTDSETKEALPFVNVVLLVNDTTVIGGTSADINGEFRIKVDPLVYKMVDLKVGYVGYPDKVIKDIKTTGNKVVNIEMENNHIELGGLIIIEQQPVEQLPSVADPFQSGKKIGRKQYRRMPK